MREYAVADVGSNTMVLIVYQIHNGIPVAKSRQSVPVHLIDYIENGAMSETGIQKACFTLMTFAGQLDQKRISFRKAFVTEPARNISNQKEFLNALCRTGFDVTPLTGQEEAELDFRGSRITYPDLMQGAAFDVGGGSTELISFHDGEIVDAISIPLGCVRLSHLPLDTPDCRNALLQARSDHKSLNKVWPTLIGIGGTCRAAGILTDHFFHSGTFMKTSDLKMIYTQLQADSFEAVTALEKLVDPDRQPLFLPGVHMILEIANLFDAEIIRVSDTGVREGFLLDHLDFLER